MSKKVIVSAAILWYGVTKLFFVNNNGIKVNKEKPFASEAELKKKICLENLCEWPDSHKESNQTICPTNAHEWKL